MAMESSPAKGSVVSSIERPAAHSMFSHVLRVWKKRGIRNFSKRSFNSSGAEPKIHSSIVPLLLR